MRCSSANSELEWPIHHNNKAKQLLTELQHWIARIVDR